MHFCLPENRPATLLVPRAVAAEEPKHHHEVHDEEDGDGGVAEVAGRRRGLMMATIVQPKILGGAACLIELLIIVLGLVQIGFILEIKHTPAFRGSRSQCYPPKADISDKNWSNFTKAKGTRLVQILLCSL